MFKRAPSFYGISFNIYLLQKKNMKNSECTIYIMSRHGWMQKYRKEKEGWSQTSSNGAVRTCTAEQLLSRILPIMAGTKGPNFSVEVEPDNKTETLVRLEQNQPETT